MKKVTYILFLLSPLFCLGQDVNNLVDGKLQVKGVQELFDSINVHRVVLDGLLTNDALDTDQDPTNEIQTLSSIGVSVDKTNVATATVTGDGNQPNNILTLTGQRADGGITIAGNQVTNNIECNFVVIDVSCWYDLPTNVGVYARVSPVLELLKNGTVVAKSATGYQRHSVNHSDSSNSFTYTDGFPALGDVYSLRAQQGSNQNDVVNVTVGHIGVRVVEKIKVIEDVTISN